jgi:hypothetical protein
VLARHQSGGQHRARRLGREARAVPRDARGAAGIGEDTDECLSP